MPLKKVALSWLNLTQIGYKNMNIIQISLEDILQVFKDLDAEQNTSDDWPMPLGSGYHLSTKISDNTHLMTIYHGS
jgi:hypothetical protein